VLPSVYQQVAHGAPSATPNATPKCRTECRTIHVPVVDRVTSWGGRPTSSPSTAHVSGKPVSPPSQVLRPFRLRLVNGPVPLSFCAEPSFLCRSSRTQLRIPVLPALSAELGTECRTSAVINRRVSGCRPAALVVRHRKWSGIERAQCLEVSDPLWNPWWF
jgi:hypothetical protein